MSDSSRYSTIVVNASVPRAEIEISRHAQVDLSLKDFRIIARRTQAFSLPFADELQILERIYYKGNNQHRSALFWRKVVEVRRLGARINGLNISNLVENIRYAFYAEEDRTNPKSLRGPWKQTPDATTCISLLKWIRSACFLVDQAQQRFRSAHQTFLQQIRHATFMPLAVSLIAITSRLDFLVTDLRDILALQWQATVRIQENISTADTNTNRDVPRLPNPFISRTTPATLKPDLDRQLPEKVNISVEPTISEDLGSKVTQDAQSVSEFQQVSLIEDKPSSSTWVSTDLPNSLSISSLPEETESLPVLPASFPVEQSAAKHTWHYIEPERAISTKSTTKSLKAAKTKKAKRRDAIDDIFGF